MSDQDLTDIILSGRLSEIPDLPKTTVKVYICSNKSDFELERYQLWKEALPALQHECVQYGLDVVWVDVHYGSHTDHVRDANKFQLHLDEIKRCHEESIGPFFVCLIGNKYGDCPLPTQLDEQLYQNIRKEALKHGKDSLLDEWYFKDANGVPIKYCLRPITHKFKCYDFRPKMNHKDHRQDVENWSKTYKELLDIMQCGGGGKSNANEKHGSSDQLDCASISGLEKELIGAFSLSPDGCIVVERNIERINTGVVGATSFVDLAKDIQIDTMKQQKLEKLKERIRTELPTENYFHFNIASIEYDNIRKALEHHDEYMDNFPAAVSTRLVRIIKPLVKKVHYAIDKNVDKLCKDVMVHLHHCNRSMHTHSVLGFEKQLRTVQDLLILGRNNEHNPILLSGPPYCGKSSFVSMLCYQCREILGPETTLIVRYVGLTPSSNNSVKLLREICMQINHALRQNIDLSSYDVSHLKSYYNGLKNRISKAANNFVIILDDIDLLEGINAIQNVDDKNDFDWLTSKLPTKVHVILSINSFNEKNTLVKSLIEKCETTESVIDFAEWTEQQYTPLVRNKLQTMQRKLTADQETAIYNMVTESSPALLDVCFEMMGKPKDASETKYQHFPTSLTEALEQKLEQLEFRFSIEIVEALISYLSISEFGISEMELLDCLSSNMDIITALDLDTQIVSRFPSHLWISFRKEIDIFLKTIYLQGKELLVWSHKDVRELMRRRYLSSTVDKTRCHIDFANLFIDSSKEDIDEFGSDFFTLDFNGTLAFPQSLAYSSSVYNLRAIEELWIQLLLSGDIAMLKGYALCNFEYMLAMVHSSSVDRMIEVLKYANSQLLDPEIALLYKTLVASRSYLSKYPKQLACELICRLRRVKNLYTNHLESFVNQAMGWCDAYNFPLLVPLTSWLPPIRVLQLANVGGFDGVRHLTVLPSGQSVLCTYGLTNIMLYHVPGKKIVKVFSGHRGIINCIELFPNDQIFATGADDKTIRIWKLVDGFCTSIFREHTGAVMCLTLEPSNGWLISGSSDTTIIIYRVSTGEILHTLKGHKKTVTCLKYIQSSKILLSASKDRSIIMWCMDDMKKISVFKDYINSPVLSIDLSVDSTFLLVACEDSSLNVISFATGSWIHQLKGHGGWINKVAVCNDCNHVVAACQDGAVYVYNLRTTELLETLKGNNQPITDIFLSCSESLVFSITDASRIIKSTLRAWSLQKRESNFKRDIDHDSIVTCVHVSDGIAASGSKNGEIKVWNLEKAEVKDTYRAHNGSVNCLQISYFGSFIVSGSSDKSLCVYDIPLSTEVIRYQEHKAPIKSVTIFQDDSQVISVDKTNVFFIWNSTSGQTLRTYNISNQLYHLTSNGSHLVVSTDGQSVKVISLEDESVATHVSHSEKITCLACSADDQCMVTGSSQDKTLKVWETFSGKLTQVLVEHESWITCVAICDEKKNVISSDQKGNIFVWSVATGQIRHKLTGHRDVITALKVPSRGELIISGSLDCTILVWSLRYGELITLFDMHCPVINFSISDDASRLMIQLEKNKYCPLLCLHNSPATEGNSPWNPADVNVLPITIKQRPRPLSLDYPVKRPPIRKRSDSASDIPEIVRLSPIRAPHAKKKGRKNILKSKRYKSKVRVSSEDSTNKMSSVCSIL